MKRKICHIQRAASEDAVRLFYWKCMDRVWVMLAVSTVGGCVTSAGSPRVLATKSGKAISQRFAIPKEKIKGSNPRAGKVFFFSQNLC